MTLINDKTNRVCNYLNRQSKGETIEELSRDFGLQTVHFGWSIRISTVSFAKHSRTSTLFDKKNVGFFMHQRHFNILF